MFAAKLKENVSKKDNFHGKKKISVLEITYGILTTRFNTGNLQ